MNKIEQFLRIGFFITAAVTLCILYFFVDARHFNFLPPCPFFVLTGWFCPGCGSQRALSALLHAHIIEAVHFNALFVVGLFVVLFFAFVNVFPINLFNSKIQKAVFSTLGIKIFIIATITFGVVRNIPVYPLTLLIP